MSSKSAKLALKLQKSDDFIVAPGVYDMISAKMADSIGFDALYMTGSGTVASHLGVPDAGIATYTDMVSRAGRVASGTNTPLIADADTGYGGVGIQVVAGVGEDAALIARSLEIMRVLQGV